MAAINAFGTLLKMGATEIAEVTNISAPSVSRDSIEYTSHSSAGGFREFMPGLKDGGEVSLDINWDPSNATHQSLYTQLNTGTANTAFSIVFPNAWEFNFNGHVTGFDATAPIDDRLTASVTIKVSGQPTLEDGE